MKATNLGMCCVSGCQNDAVELAAPNVTYCHRHAAINRQTTVNMLHQQTEGQIKQSIAAARDRHLKAEAVITGKGTVIVDGESWDIAIGTQHDPKIVALRSPRYRETSYGDVIFVRPGESRYDEFAASAEAV